MGIVVKNASFPKKHTPMFKVVCSGKTAVTDLDIHEATKVCNAIKTPATVVDQDNDGMAHGNTAYFSRFPPQERDNVDGEE